MKADEMASPENVPNPITFKRGFRYFAFILIFSINIVVNMDHGTLPAATNDIMKDLNITEKTLGIFGSLVYLGNMIGKDLLNIRLNNIFCDNIQNKQKAYSNNLPDHKRLFALVLYFIYKSRDPLC